MTGAGWLITLAASATPSVGAWAGHRLGFLLPQKPILAASLHVTQPFFLLLLSYMFLHFLHLIMFLPLGLTGPSSLAS